MVEAIGESCDSLVHEGCDESLQFQDISFHLFESLLLAFLLILSDDVRSDASVRGLHQIFEYLIGEVLLEYSPW